MLQVPALTALNICQECIIQDSGEGFCTRVCARKHKRTDATVQAYKEHTKPSHFIRNLIYRQQQDTGLLIIKER